MYIYICIYIYIYLFSFSFPCWKVAAEILERKAINILHLVFYFTLKKCIASRYYCL